MRDWKAVIRARLGALPVDPAREADIVDELAQHVGQHHADLVARGVPDEEAAARALAPLADRDRLVADLVRADRPRSVAPVPPATGGRLAADLAADLRYAARLLRRSPGFAAAAIVTLALGIGANTAIFTVVNAVLLRPLPYADPARLAFVGERGTDGSASPVGYATFLDWKARTHAFEDMTLVRSWTPTLVVNGQPQRVAALRVSANFFRLLGATPAIGRDFTAAEDNPNDWRVVILSDAFWRRRFNADPAIVGSAITVNDRSAEVIGVMPPSFEPLISQHFYDAAEMWSLVGYDTTQSFACRTCQHLRAMGRLRNGVGPDAARTDMAALQAQLAVEHPTEYPRATTMAVVPLRDELTGAVRPVLSALMAAVAMVLLIACANVANLLLARTARRRRDLALRAALGASRTRLVRQAIAESLLLSAAGGTVGVAFCIWAVPLLIGAAPASLSRAIDARVDARVLVFSLLVSAATAVAFGLVPALRGSRAAIGGMLQDNRKTAHAPASAARRLLLAADVALAVVLLAGAGLMVRSVGTLLGVDPGFDAHGVLTTQISMAGSAFATNEATLAATNAIIARLHALPGVESVGAASQVPLGGNGDRFGFHVQSRPAENAEEDPALERYGVTPEYFAAMRIPLRRGRYITDADAVQSDPVILVNDRAARTLFPNADPIGEHVRIGSATDGPWRTIVGIVGDVRHNELAAPPTMQFYVPETQFTDGELTLVVRTAGDPSHLAGPVAGAIAAVASQVPVYHTALLEDLVARSVAPRRFMMVLLELFGAAALLLTAVGVYGVISYSVAERTQEIGIRAALGASRGDILRVVLGAGMVTILAGITVGLVAALGATRYLQGSLYGVTPQDPLTLVSVAGLLLAVAVIAQLVPTTRALRVDPAVALRHD